MLVGTERLQEIEDDAEHDPLNAVAYINEMAKVSTNFAQDHRKNAGSGEHEVHCDLLGDNLHAGSMWKGQKGIMEHKVVQSLRAVVEAQELAQAMAPSVHHGRRPSERRLRADHQRDGEGY